MPRSIRGTSCRSVIKLFQFQNRDDIQSGEAVAVRVC